VIASETRTRRVLITRFEPLGVSHAAPTVPPSPHQFKIPTSFDEVGSTTRSHRVLELLQAVPSREHEVVGNSLFAVNENG
jgi:hypothetical protein